MRTPTKNKEELTNAHQKTLANNARVFCAWATRKEKPRKYLYQPQTDNVFYQLSDRYFCNNIPIDFFYPGNKEGMKEKQAGKSDLWLKIHKGTNLFLVFIVN